MKQGILLLLLALLCACGGNLSQPESGAAQASSSEASSFDAVQSRAASEEAVPSDYMLELAEHKAELVEVVAYRVEQYRAGADTLHPNHHAPWPESFPPVSELPTVDGPEDFSVRQTENPTALGGIYLAVPVAEGFEMRMDAAKFLDADGKPQWGSGHTFFSHEGAFDWKDWTLSDLEP